jgi:hypothetical protein
MALPASAAKIIDVRVGEHAGFTRVVFELDSPVGYKVERHAAKSGRNELVVSLDAGAEEETLSRSRGFIKSVEIKSDGRRSTAHMRLVGSGLRLKEMILASPPRIVLDVLDEQAIKAAASAKARSQKRTVLSWSFLRSSRPGSLSE